MALTAAQIEQQRKQAEELLFSGPQTLGFAKGLFFGHFNGQLLFPYPELRPDERVRTEQKVAEVRRYAQSPLQPSSYGLGREAILALRDKARAAGWGMRLFHDRLLGAGSLPPKLLATELGL